MKPCHTYHTNIGCVYIEAYGKQCVLYYKNEKKKIPLEKMFPSSSRGKITSIPAVGRKKIIRYCEASVIRRYLYK